MRISPLNRTVNFRRGYIVDRQDDGKSIFYPVSKVAKIDELPYEQGAVIAMDDDKIVMTRKPVAWSLAQFIFDTEKNPDAYCSIFYL